jgi:hypothetical protein
MPLLLSLLGIGRMIKGVLSSLPWQVYAALGVILGLLLGWHIIAVRERAAWNAGYNVGFNSGWQSQQPYLAAARRSVVNLQAGIDGQNKAIEAWRADGNARALAAASALEAAQKAAQSAQGAIKALEVSAGKSAPAGSCKASAAYLEEKEKL